MKRLAIALALVAWFLVLPARAEKPTPARLGLEASMSDLKATPEMWFYDQQLRQYMDPKMAVRENAEMRANQRMRRIESMKWYGFSNSRPTVNADPFDGDYAPHWTSNSNYYPSRWNGIGFTSPVH